jgi:hypothetical protein
MKMTIQFIPADLDLERLYSNGDYDTLDPINENALGVRADSNCYDREHISPHHSKSQPLTQGFAMSQKKILKKSTWTKYVPPYHERHVTIPSTLIVNKNLSDAGFRLLNYMFSNCDQWDLYMHKIAEDLGWGREKSTRAVMEIIELGYAKRELVREEGRFSHYNYHYYCQPIFYEENKKLKKQQEDAKLKEKVPCTGNPRVVDHTPLKTILSNDLKKINQSTTIAMGNLDEELIDDLSSEIEKEKKHIHRDCFLTDSEYQNCLRQKGTKEAIIEIIDNILDWPDRKNSIKEWEKTILKWTKSKKTIDVREKNQKIGKELVSKYENITIGWSVREYRDTIKDDFGILFEPQGCNSSTNHFFSYSDTKFQNKIDDCCKLTVNRNK